MSLTVKHLNSDASFLLSFEPISTFPPSPGLKQKAFTIVLDPWLTGSSTIWHSKFSTSTHKKPSCVSSLSELPEPDLVIISQDKTDHCHAPTLKQLPASGGKTIILAEPGAAKTIRGWKYFDSSKVVTLPRWEKTKSKRNSAIYRIPVPSPTLNGTPGEVTVTWLTQKLDVTGLHSAVGITYRPPAATNAFAQMPLTPPASPQSYQSTFSPSVADRALSVIFSPHGCAYNILKPYAESHLVSEAALPLTALLHCFDRVTNPWYLGGNICAGFPGGLEIAQNLCAKTWISAHDGDKLTKGFAASKIVTEKYEREDVESVISPRSPEFPHRRLGTEAVVLDVGSEVRLSQAMTFGPGDMTPES
ncbi:hypothetical protein BP5796_10661 [Coleophoma crateriformis]|uniref:Metallo-beta-lactamase domain-containing protein n=1 Tax=Coleophoma crateriformis TaxID=565419 RepID=A0A3D8QQS7_9HELO|nr:hypothetical protein BP5796_10661 [Coleophoma crateriformis]